MCAVVFIFGGVVQTNNRFSTISLSQQSLVLSPSLFICNKLSNVGSAIFVAQVLLLEL